MKTRHLVIAVAVVLAVAACDSPSKPASESTTTPPAASTSTSTAATTSAAPTITGASACTELKGTVSADNLCTVHTETPNYTIDMSFPVDYPDQRAVVDVLSKQRDGFVALVDEPPARDVPKALDIKSQTFRSGTETSGTESLVFEEYSNFGGAHPVTNYDALNYDLGKKAPITFDTLFKPSADPVGVLDPLVKAELTKQLPDAPIGDNSVGAEMYKNFALTDDAVLFFISQGQWTISAELIPTIVLNETYAPYKDYVSGRAKKLTEEGTQDAADRYAVGTGLGMLLLHEDLKKKEKNGKADILTEDQLAVARQAIAKSVLSIMPAFDTLAKETGVEG